MPGNIQQNTSIVDIVQALARDKSCTPAQIALAWLLSKGDDIVPIPGTKRTAYLRENVGAAEIRLSDLDFRTLEADIAALQIMGKRYTEEGMKGAVLHGLCDGRNAPLPMNRIT